MNQLYTLFFLFSLFLSLLNPISTASSPLNGKIKDAQKLLAFKSSLPNPNILSNWQETTDPCHFTAVLCNNSRVTSLNFTSFSLSTNFSSVSTHLFSIELLTSLFLSSSNVSGSLQPFSICPSSLIEIDLSHNFISGSFSNLSFFSSCSSLSSLNLSYCLLDFFPEDLRSAQFGLSLKRLDVSGNLLSGEQLLPWVLTQGCDKLSHLALKGNKLEGSFSLSKCSNLEFLDLSSNNFSTFMPNLEKDCFKLKHLDLSSNKFLGKIERLFVGCSSLSFLNVSNNQLTGGLPNFPSSTSIEFLYLGNNKFQGLIPQSLADDVCSTLIELDLSFNNLFGMIPAAFKSCSLLENFDVSNNNFSGKLPVDVLLKMGNLKKLSLGYNHFEGVLPDSFSMLSSLESVDLSSNSIAGEIPPNICQNYEGKPSNLKELNLQNNLFTGQIPPTLGNCSQLVTLDLSSNYLTGRIPTSLGSLTQLKDLIMWMNKLEGDIPQELTNSRALENLILDYNELTGTIPSGLRNCRSLNCLSLSSNKLSGRIPSWIGSLNNLAILKLSNNSFYGEIPPELGDCKSLLWLDLNSNSLTGTIPPTLPKQSGTVGLNVGKKFWYFRNNGGNGCQGTGILLEFSGIRQDAINRIPTRCKFEQIYLGHTKPNFNHNGSMIFLDLSYNKFQGSIPKELGTMFYLWILNLGHNNLSGQIPEELAGLQHIGIMYLSHNHLSGPIPPSLGTLSSLTDMDLSNNELSGGIPATAQLTSFPPSRFYNNSGLCGFPLPVCDGNPKTNSLDHHQKHGKSLAWSVAMGLFCSVFCIFGLIMVVLEVKKRSKKKESFHDIYTEGNSQSNSTSAWNFISKREALSISLATFENKPLRKLTYADLLEATNGFHDDSMIGKGGFGDVYKAQLKDGSVVAIKKLIHISGQGDREFIAEMETIGKIKHKNLVPLLGYCKVKEERLLVYEYMKYGSLDDVLHNPKKVGMNLNWAARRKIAIGAAQGLAFLHHNCNPHIIHRDMKSSNVLVDENLEARVSDFGMARLMSAMDTHLSVSTLAGTPGYVPPEYYQSFRCSTKGDVYSYGVVLLELLTGKQATDSSDFGDNNLVGWVKSYAKLRISDVFDPLLIKEDPTLEMELLQHLNIACACLDDRASRRPTMIQVIAMLKNIEAGSGHDSVSTISAENGSSNATMGAGSLNTTVDVLDTSIEEVSESEGNYKQ